MMMVFSGSIHHADRGDDISYGWNKTFEQKEQFFRNSFWYPHTVSRQICFIMIIISSMWVLCKFLALEDAIPEWDEFPENMSDILWHSLNNLTPPIRPINDPVLQILVNQQEACSKIEKELGQPPRLLILIKSTPNNRARRQAIRSTWGNSSCWGVKESIVRLFMIGLDPEQTEKNRTKLSEEIERYGDIIQQDSVDRYDTTVYKIMLGLDWSVRYCSSAGMIILVDDDYFISPRKVIRFIERLKPTEIDVMFGGDKLDQTYAPIRYAQNEYVKKYQLSYEEYPHDVFPNYIAGGFVILSNKVARKLSVATRYTKYVRLDDVFLGLAARKLKLEPIEIRYVYSRLGAEWSWLSRYYMAVHLSKGVEWIHTFWKQSGSAELCTHRS